LKFVVCDAYVMEIVWISLAHHCAASSRTSCAENREKKNEIKHNSFMRVIEKYRSCLTLCSDREALRRSNGEPAYDFAMRSFVLDVK
jgi:hypothetical protein